jgi:hypothetical protein
VSRLFWSALLLLAFLSVLVATYAQSQVGPLGGAGVSLPLSTANGGTGSSNGSLISTGTPPTTAGSTCTAIGTQVGGNTAGRLVATCTAQTLVLTFATTAPNGWSCKASDQTTPADAMNQNGSTATTATLIGTTAAGDTISFMCMGY